jgi:hypothetical protein
MSILDSLLRFIDPIEFRQKQQERRRASRAEAPRRAGPPLVCRVCGYTGGPEHRYCPRCLAETMERKR